MLMQFSIHRCLMSNAHGRWNGAEKSQRHIELCSIYLAVLHGTDQESAMTDHEIQFRAVHEKTQELTDALDEEIGFPLESRPDYDKLAPLFFDKFIELAEAAVGKADAS